MNGNLVCLASTCFYNKCSSCYANGINISGSIASNTNGTHCLTFEDRKNATLTNSTSNEDYAKTHNIACQAKECKHNDESSCVALNVQINNENQSCETFCPR
ncbi:MULTISPECIES: DUF1540 domain-containing protein [Romboutsia]|uniref:DUF1540 domain-containing protein n=1 Tax=Romboutsia TaxID=1501226 RepID=UPI000B85BCA0|nr:MULTISPECIES: DUF1540 domain-containing protein [Romboutsia]MCH1959546.1 DUF1540 domain-containing protein [Romboutsia hominis]MCH1970032.1 DUF1540 domain-containing protein [Romboutsia hominis]MDB8803939.1 DUF1540 domain-containing protein [Romboutsia sp. 1001216sp1]MDB8806711.1 DUF1540 domain-containing protein [Romboutsia sp. 1001216sp1]MDB8809586.1 DUF1540 domain-containing protein [Romboutsia sp. 1001216sp1]